MTASLLVRLPADLKERLRKAAFDRRESQNAIVVKAIERELGQEEMTA